MVIEAAVALWSAYVAKSITLLAFGLDSVIELISAGVLVLAADRRIAPRSFVF